MEIHGIVRAVQGNEIVISDRSGDVYEFEVGPPWNVFITYLKKMDIVFIRSSDTFIGDQSIFVIEPYYQVPVTRTVEAIDCPRKVYVKHMGAEFLDDDPHLMRRQTQGNLLHNLFTQQITQPVDIDDAIEDTIAKSKIDLITTDMSEHDARNYLIDNGMLLKTFSIKGKSEVDVQNWKYGLHGKFDALTENKIIELKSSTIPESTPWPSHNYQLNTYISMMEDVDNYDGIVLYLNEGDIGIKYPSLLRLVEIIVARNWVYLVQTGIYLPPILRGQESRICRNCYVKLGCRKLCAGLETQRDCEICTHNSVCDKQIWPDESYLYNQNIISALNAEENEVKKEEYARVAYLTNKFSMEAAINQGEAILTTNKIEEILENGFYYTTFQHESIMPKFRRGDYGSALNLDTSVSSTSLYENVIIVKIDDHYLTLQSLNSLAERCLIVPSNSASLIRRGRRAVYRATVHQGNLINLIRSSLKDEFSLDPYSISAQITDPLLEYNEIQHEAILRSLSTPDILLIQGPAGTGKTSVIVEIIHQLIKKEKTILCAAFTNMAVDNIGVKLKHAGIEFLRLGNVHSIREDLKEYSIDNKEEYFRKISTENMSGVILSTTTTIANPRYDGLFFDYVLIDEAAQMMETDSLQALLQGEKAILVGDHAQLQPIVTSKNAQSLGLHISMFERLVSKLSNRYILLKDQYRMSDDILEFPNKTFYQGELRSANSQIANQNLEIDDKYLNSDESFQAIHITTENNSKSQVNYQEALLTAEIVLELLQSEKIELEEIGIITPFRAQVRLLRDILPGMDIDTVDRYQGSEREVIILSTITTADIPLIADDRRINVALTRAKRKLVVLLTNIRDENTAPILHQLFVNALQRDVVDEITRSDDASGDIQAAHQHYIDLTGQKGTRIIVHDLLANNALGFFYNSIEMILQQFTKPYMRCAICWQEVDEGVECPGCNYHFHLDHLETWILKKESCPTCKHTIINRKHGK